MNELAITVIGRDRPGIVADVAEVLARLGANLTDSTMTRLRGHFAMTLICVGPSAAEVEDALGPLTADGQLLATVRQVRPDGETVPTGERYVMSVHGADRMGIVAAMTRAVTVAGGNVTDLSTRLVGSLYVVVAEVDLPADVTGTLPGQLAEVAAGLGVEVTLRPADPDLL
ncbi:MULTISPECIES: glycine cleavage system protein R [Micromonospora]|uniref:Amino acid-binding protein n=2 Tax=Micromonospora TaxID=1873 RepID=A0A9X0I4D9_9ACTN|nr:MULTISPECIES: ACT domain-containing protein [Micromonospora]AEB47618.1 amino acid-binding act domain protein [Micromonospora maris AB-18-032]AIS85573.1 amino acid-binding act domain protein [Verrucosispora sp. MS100047]KUJ46663.1 amino acid-binding protein [Micromonospora maris]RUL93936.1 amino acid-binding protein [Verrucosispora sp. FIM060022]